MTPLCRLSLPALVSLLLASGCGSSSSTGATGGAGGAMASSGATMSNGAGGHGGMGAGGQGPMGPVDATTVEGKLMMGYQGWFACPGDGAPPSRWVHWFGMQDPVAANATFDLWPDTTELEPDELF